MSVRTISDQFRPISDAQQLHQETNASITKRGKMAEACKQNALTMPYPDSHPNKKRLNLIKCKYDEPGRAD